MYVLVFQLPVIQKKCERGLGRRLLNIFVLDETLNWVAS